MLLTSEIGALCSRSGAIGKHLDCMCDVCGESETVLMQDICTNQDEHL